MTPILIYRTLISGGSRGFFALQPKDTRKLHTLKLLACETADDDKMVAESQTIIQAIFARTTQPTVLRYKQPPYRGEPLVVAEMDSNAYGEIGALNRQFKPVWTDGGELEAAYDGEVHHRWLVAAFHQGPERYFTVSTAANTGATPS